MRQRRHPHPHRYDPLAPLAPYALRKQVAADARAQTIPLARELTRQINAQAAAGAANIAGVSNQLASTLGSQQGVQREIYDRARGNLGALDTQQQSALGTSGGAISEDLRARLASAGAPAGLADSLAAASRGAAGAGFARGSAEVGQLTQNEAGAESYAAKLPGLAQLAGLQGVSDRRAQAQKDLAQGLGDLSARTPGLVAQLTEAARNREYEKGVARLGFAGDVAKLDAQDQRANQAEAGRNHRAALSHADRQASIAAANKRSGMTLQERADYHNRSLAEQAKADQARAHHNKVTEHQQVANEKGRERRSRRTAKNKKKSGSKSGNVPGYLSK